MSTVWWVNQGDSSRHGHFEIVWAPKYSSRQLKDGTFVTPRHWATLLSPVKGDFVIHAASQQIRAISRVLGRAVEERRPPQLGSSWGTEGYRLPTETVKLDHPIPFQMLGPDFLRKFSGKDEPFTAKVGDVAAPKQGYFFIAPSELASAVFNILDVSNEIDPGDGRKINFQGSSDVDVTTKIRREQPQLRSLLLDGRIEANCSLCGTIFPVKYLVASHIKRRADCDEDERRDINVAMLACLFGCDKAFEEGDLFVDHKGVLQASSRAHSEVKNNLNHLVGRKVPIYDEKNKKYFTARRKQYGN